MERTESVLKKGKNGSVLAYVMAAFAVITIIIAAVLSLFTMTMKITLSKRDLRLAYIYAKSGIEYARSIVSNKRQAGEFIIYGNFEEEIKSAIKNTEPDNAKNSKIYAVLSVGQDAQNNRDLRFTIKSVGTVNKAVRTLSLEGILIGELIEIPVDAKLASDKPHEWYDGSGRLSNNPIHDTIDGAAIFNATINCITKENDSKDSINAEQMYFMNTPISVYVEKNHTLSLRSDFYYFEGDATGHEKDTHFFLYTRDSTLSGDELGMRDGTYGIFCLSPEAEVKAGGNVIIASSPNHRFFFFRSGVDILRDDMSNDIKEVSYEDILTYAPQLGTEIVLIPFKMEGIYSD